MSTPVASTPAVNRSVNKWARTISGADETGGGQFIQRHGNYLLALKEIVDKTEKTDAAGNVIKEAGHKGNSFVYRFVVVGAEPNSKTGSEGTHQIGESLSAVFKLDDKELAGKHRNFLRALFGIKSNECTEAWLVGIWPMLEDPAQPLMGKLVKAISYEYINTGKRVPENRGKPGISQTWEPVAQTVQPTEGQTAPSVVEMRAKLLAG